MSVSRQPDATPPNIDEYLGIDGLLHKCVSQNTILWKLTHHVSGKLKQHLVRITKDDKEGSLHIFDQTGNIMDDFLDANGVFIPFAYTDGSLIEVKVPSEAAGLPDQSHRTFLSAVESVTRNAALAYKDLPSVNVWDGSPDGWIPWKESIYARMLAQGIPFDSVNSLDVSSLTVSDQEKQIANLVHQYTKRGNTEHGRRVTLYHMQSRDRGSEILSKLVSHYEKDNVYYLKTLLHKLDYAKLKFFPTKGRRSADLFNVEDFYNTLDTGLIKYEEAGGH